jgi:hypothetical protein
VIVAEWVLGILRKEDIGMLGRRSVAKLHTHMLSSFAMDKQEAEAGGRLV